MPLLVIVKFMQPLNTMPLSRRESLISLPHLAHPRQRWQPALAYWLQNFNMQPRKNKFALYICKSVFKGQGLLADHFDLKECLFENKKECLFGSSCVLVKKGKTLSLGQQTYLLSTYHELVTESICGMQRWLRQLLLPSTSSLNDLLHRITMHLAKPFWISKLNRVPSS